MKHKTLANAKLLSERSNFGYGYVGHGTSSLRGNRAELDKGWPAAYARV